MDHLARDYRKVNQTVGIIAVDPTSPYTGGAILGDRIRMQEHFADRRNLHSEHGHAGMRSVAWRALLPT